MYIHHNIDIVIVRRIRRLIEAPCIRALRTNIAYIPVRKPVFGYFVVVEPFFFFILSAA